ncbi:hypothetical protein ACXJJ3_41685 [Kribbella sp. WER1]
MLLTAGAVAGAAGCSGRQPGSGPVEVRYGPDDAQTAALYLPSGGARVAVAVVIHGGFWMREYGVDLAVPLAQDLAGGSAPRVSITGAVS